MTSWKQLLPSTQRAVSPLPAEPLHTGCMLTSLLEASVVRLLHRGPMERVFLRVLILKLSHSWCSCSSRFFLLTVVWVWKIAFFGLYFFFLTKKFSVVFLLLLHSIFSSQSVHSNFPISSSCLHLCPGRRFWDTPGGKGLACVCVYLALNCLRIVPYEK